MSDDIHAPTNAGPEPEGTPSEEQAADAVEPSEAAAAPPPEAEVADLEAPPTPAAAGAETEPGFEPDPAAEAVTEPAPAAVPEPAPEVVSEPVPEPTPTVSESEATWSRPPGSAAPDAAWPPAPATGPFPPDRPELVVGAAFAGGFLAAMILKRLGRR